MTVQEITSTQLHICCNAKKQHIINWTQLSTALTFMSYFIFHFSCRTVKTTISKLQVL